MACPDLDGSRDRLDGGPARGLAGTAIILAGGRSRRMGRPKAALPFGDETLLRRLVRIYRGWFGEVLVAAAPGQDLPEAPAPVLRDAVEGLGPLAGISSGLRAAGFEACFVTSCDHPFPDRRVVDALMAGLLQADACVARWEDRLQPTFAAYRRGLAGLCEAQLAAGELAPVRLYDKVRTRILEPAELIALEPEGLSMLDVNDPETYLRALERLARREP
jgi:molybdopterin-guanine dinucleotide biosynthesis protein A